MKIGEALSDRAALQQSINDLRDRIEANMVTQEGDQPDEDANKLLEELETKIDQLYHLVARINRTNMLVKLPNGKTLMEALAEREAVGSKHATMVRLTRRRGFGGNRYSRSELRDVKHVDTGKLARKADSFAQQRRTIDAAIQAVNWSEDLVG